MHIVISQTNHLVHKQSILVDIGTFNNIEAWITALINKKTVFEPINATISFNNATYDIVKDNELSPSITFLMKKIRRLPSDITHFPNDKSVIEVDSFAHTLHFNLDGCSKTKNEEQDEADTRRMFAVPSDNESSS